LLLHAGVTSGEEYGRRTGWRTAAIRQQWGSKHSAEKEAHMSKKAIIILSSVAIVFMALVGGGFFMMWTKIARLMPPEEVVQEAPVEEEEMVAVGEMFPLDTFVVNLADANGKRYLRTTMQLELAPEEHKETFEQRLPQIRDVILTILPTKTFEDIRTAEGKSALRTEILNRLNDLLNGGNVVNLYFTEFVIQ
jgi:flagellar FliL protein